MDFLRRSVWLKIFVLATLIVSFLASHPSILGVVDTSHQCTEISFVHSIQAETPEIHENCYLEFDEEELLSESYVLLSAFKSAVNNLKYSFNVYHFPSGLYRPPRIVAHLFV